MHGRTIACNHTAFELYRVTFTAADVAAEKQHAIIELQFTDADANVFRRIVYSTVLNDEFRVWSINVEPPGDLLFDASVSAVIEHSFLLSTVRCNPEALLKVLRENSKRLPGEMRRLHLIEDESK